MKMVRFNFFCETKIVPTWKSLQNLRFYLYCTLKFLKTHEFFSCPFSDDEMEDEDILDDEEDAADNNPTGLEAIDAASTGRVTVSKVISATPQDCVIGTDAGFEYVRNEENTWVPLCIMNTYRDAMMVDRVVLKILLPSGVGEKDSTDVTMSTEKDATELRIEVEWPDLLMNEDKFHDPLEEKNDYSHENEILRKHALKSRMAELRATRHDKIKSTTRIPLPFKVEPQIKDEQWCFAGDAKGSRVLYIDLKQPTEGTYLGKSVKPLKNLDAEATETTENV